MRGFMEMQAIKYFTNATCNDCYLVNFQTLMKTNCFADMTYALIRGVV